MLKAFYWTSTDISNRNGIKNISFTGDKDKFGMGEFSY